MLKIFLNIVFWLCLTPLLLMGQNQVVLKGGYLVQTGGMMVVKDGSLTNNAIINQIDGSVKMTGTASDAQSQIGGTAITTFHTLEIAKGSNNASLGQNILTNNLIFNGGHLDIDSPRRLVRI